MSNRKIVHIAKKKKNTVQKGTDKPLRLRQFKLMLIFFLVIVDQRFNEVVFAKYINGIIEYWLIFLKKFISQIKFLEAYSAMHLALKMKRDLFKVDQPIVEALKYKSRTETEFLSNSKLNRTILVLIKQILKNIKK